MANNDATVTISENKTFDSVINKSMHNLFIDKANIKQNIVIPLSNINSTLVSNNERTDGNGERYNITLQQRSVYSKCIEKDMDIKIAVNNVVTKERSQLFKVQTENDKNYAATHQAWNSNPWNAGLLRHRTDFINSCCQSTNVQKGNVSGSNNMPLNPHLINVLRKLENQEMLKDTYKGILTPETFNLNYKINLSSDDKLSGDKMMANGSADSGKLTPASTTTYTIDSPVTSLSRLQTVLPQQQQFDTAEYEFTKGKESYNYRWDTEAKELKRTERSQKLYTIKVGKSSYPTNIENYDDFLKASLDGSPGLAAVYWYTNKKSLIQKPTGDPVPFDPAPLNGEDEPGDQTLNIVITFKASGPVFHPLLETSQGISFTNIQTFKIDSSYHSDLFQNMFYNIFKPGKGEELGTPRVSISNQQLRLTQLDCSLLENSFKNRISLPFVQYKEFIDTRKVKLVKEGSKVGFKPVTFNINCGFTGHVPKRAIIFLSSPDNLPSKFDDLRLTFAGQNSVVQQTIDDLINASRLNSLHMTAADQFNSYKVLSRYSNIKTIPSQCGTVLYLEYGNNLPVIYNSTRPLTASSFADGMSSDYKITVNGMFETDIEYDMNKEYEIQMNIYHLNDAEGLYSENRLDINTLGFNNADLASAIMDTKASAESNELVMNLDDIIHSGGKSTMRKLKRKNTSTTQKPQLQSQPQSQTTNKSNNGFMSDYILNRK